MEQILNQYQDTKPYYQFITGLATGLWLEQNVPGFRIISRFTEDEILVTNGKVILMSQIPIIFISNLIHQQLMNGIVLEEIETIDWTKLDWTQLSETDWVSIEMMKEYGFIGVIIV